MNIIKNCLNNAIYPYVNIHLSQRRILYCLTLRGLGRNLNCSYHDKISFEADLHETGHTLVFELC